MNSKTRSDIFQIFEIYSYQQKTDEEILNVDWNEGSFYGNWRNYVMPLFREKWQKLSALQRLILYCKAVEEAEGEPDTY